MYHTSVHSGFAWVYTLSIFPWYTLSNENDIKNDHQCIFSGRRQKIFYGQVNPNIFEGEIKLTSTVHRTTNETL